MLAPFRPVSGHHHPSSTPALSPSSPPSFLKNKSPLSPRVSISPQSGSTLQINLIFLIIIFLCNSPAVSISQTMKVHPVPKKRNITVRYDISSGLSDANTLFFRQKRLRRLPHIFSRVLELPFHADADVSVQETPDFYKFSAATDGIGTDVRAHTMEIYPGVVKIVIRGSILLDFPFDELELDIWRFRLPPSTRPELATAMYSDGELVVTVPKYGDN